MVTRTTYEGVQVWKARQYTAQVLLDDLFLGTLTMDVLHHGKPAMRRVLERAARFAHRVHIVTVTDEKAQCTWLEHIEFVEAAVTRRRLEQQRTFNGTE